MNADHLPPAPPTPTPLGQIDTPALLLDAAVMRRNIARMRNRLTEAGVVHRPHVKTAKSMPAILAMATPGQDPVTASTLQEAQACADAGFRDIVYAVGIAPGKLDRVLAMRRTGLALTVLLDSVAAAQAVASAHRRSVAEGGPGLSALIELDTDGQRAGIKPDDPTLLTIASTLAEAGVDLQGVLTHAGASYGAKDREGIAEVAELERLGAVTAAQRLRAAGHPAPVVSIGSTPTATMARGFEGVTEVRTGVHVFHDLTMAGLEVCDVSDIALSVLTTVIGHQPDRGWVMVDAGWTALSRDLGLAGKRGPALGYGLVCDQHGVPVDQGLWIVSGVNQEHGIVSQLHNPDAAPLTAADKASVVQRFAVGSQLRILPHHACATAAQHQGYHVLHADPTRATTTGKADTPVVDAYWARFQGW